MKGYLCRLHTQQPGKSHANLGDGGSLASPELLLSSTQQLGALTLASHTEAPQTGQPKVQTFHGNKEVLEPRMPQAFPHLRDNEVLCYQRSRRPRSCKKSCPDAGSVWVRPAAGHPPCRQNAKLPRRGWRTCLRECSLVNRAQDLQPCYDVQGPRFKSLSILSLSLSSFLPLSLLNFPLYYQTK